ncbi:immunoglobulin domain-containing protein [Shewanella basaltis]|uniref:immunoglobulin domain-containing protein n=1 Tax=Shewanella basaltis TaxID=472183 RepID=UPI00200F64F7|nr:immunoglobulin domain-containing protein [Shewanella basaltis]MCL1114676.1 immunoglobulin domain-containing protein [Shewanella basaltis]
MNAFKPAFRPAIRPAITSVFGVQVPVVTPLSFVSQPQSQTVDEYATATFSCEVAGGIAPYTYQWKKNGVNVGTNSDTLSFVTASTDNYAYITVVVTDSVGTAITSTVAVLGVTSYVYVLDGITQDFTMNTSIVCDAGNTFKFSVAAKAGVQSAIFGDGTTEAVIFNANGSVDIKRGSWYYGVYTGLTIDGNKHDYVWTLGGALYEDGVLKGTSTTYPRTVSTIGRYSTTRLSGYVKNVSLEGVNKSLFLNLNNKSQGASQGTTPLSAYTAVITNYNAAGWTAI